MRLISQLHILAPRKDLMTSVVLIPLRHGGVLVHILDDIAPTDTGVVSAKRNLTFLGTVRNDAHFRAAEVVVEEILEPHTGDKEEVPTIASSLIDIVRCAATIDL